MITTVASFQQVGWCPACSKVLYSELKWSGICVYAFLMHSNPMLSGPGALVDGEEKMAFRISSGLIGGHWRCCLLVGGVGSRSAVGGGGKSDCLNSCAFPWKVVAVRPFSWMSGVGSVRLGLVYLKAVNMSLPRAFLRKSFQRLVLASFIVRW